MRGANAKGSHQNACNRDDHQRGEVDIANGTGWQARCGLSRPDVAQCVGNSDGESEGRAGRHRVVDGNIRPRHERDTHKTAARTLAQKLNVPVLPGTEDAVTERAEALRIAKKIGFPLIIKAAFGGGGRGMRWRFDVPRRHRS